MKSREDKNDVCLVGKVAQAKCWPARGQNLYTNGTVTLQVGEQALRVTVQVNGAKDANDLKRLVASFEKTFQPGATVAITKGQLSSWVKKPKDGEAGSPQEVFQIDAKLNGSYRVDVTSFTTEAVVSGKVSGAKGNWALVESFYFAGGPGGRTGEVKSRKLKIFHPETDFEAIKEKHVTAIGEVSQNEKGPFVKARVVSVFAE